MKKSIISLFIFAILSQSFCILQNDTIKKTIKLKETFTIAVKANASTGYSWTWTNKDKCKIVKLDTVTYKTDCKDPKMVGCGGTETYKFKGIKKGVETIILKYARSWETDKEAADTKTIVVTVK